MSRHKVRNSRKQHRLSESQEIQLLEQWIEARKPDCGTNPLAIPPPPPNASVGRTLDGGFTPYAGCKLFRQLPISRKTKEGLGTKYKEMSEIQRASLPHSLCGRDILGAAKTGSGKTLAFIIPVVEKLYRARWGPEDGVGSIIISPTKELAGQLFEELKIIGKNHTLSAGLLIGGRKDVDAEKDRVSSLNILICTPGRLLQHMNETPNFECSQLQVLVLDEADRMLDKNKNEHSSSWYYKDSLSDHCNDGSLLREANGYSKCDKEMLKRMMLEHEATFTLQVCELHRLYRIQKDLMNELKYREQQKHCSIFQTNIFASHMLSEVSEEFRQMSHFSALGGHSTTGNAVKLPLKHYNESSTQNFQITIKTADSSVVECDFLKPKPKSLPRKKFDLHLPAEIYIDIDDETISAKQKKPCLRVANLLSITHNADGNNNAMLSHKNKADESINGGLRPGVHPENVSSKMVLVDLNEPLKLSSYDEGEVLTSEDNGSTTEHEEAMGHHLHSERSLLSRDFFLGYHAQKPTVFTGSVNTEKGNCSQGWLSPTNACGEFKCIANSSDKGLCDGEFSIVTPSAEMESKKYDQFILPDQNKSDKWIGEISSPGPETSKFTSKLPNLNRSELATTQLPHPFPNAPHSDIFSISSLPWRTSNGVPNLSTSVINSMKAYARPCNECNQSDDVQYVDAHSKQIFKNDSNFCQIGFQQDVIQSLEPCFRKNIGQHDSLNIEESAFQIESLKPDTNTLASSVKKKILGFPIPEMCRVDFRNQVRMHSSASSRVSGEYLEGKWVTETEKDIATETEKDIASEEEIKEFNCNLTNVSFTLNKEDELNQRDGSHEAAENLIAMSFLISNHSHDHTCPSTPTSSDTLYWFADFVASTELSTEISREKSPVYDNDEDAGFDMFEFLTLKLKEIKDEFVWKPQENQSHDDSLTASPLLTRSQRGLARKRRQRRDFQKDILPGLASLSRHEVTEDLQSFESIMRASEKSWKTVSSRSTKWKQKNCRAKRRRRTRSLPFTAAEISIGSSPKQEISTAGILGWGRTTRRCQRQKVLPGILSVPLV